MPSFPERYHSQNFPKIEKSNEFNQSKSSLMLYPGGFVRRATVTAIRTREASQQGEIDVFIDRRFLRCQVLFRVLFRLPRKRHQRWHNKRRGIRKNSKNHLLLFLFYPVAISYYHTYILIKVYTLHSKNCPIDKPS